MAKNVLQKHWNGSAWVEMHPITKATNVLGVGGMNVAEQFEQLMVASWHGVGSSIGNADATSAINALCALAKSQGKRFVYFDEEHTYTLNGKLDEARDLILLGQAKFVTTVPENFLIKVHNKQATPTMKLNSCASAVKTFTPLFQALSENRTVKITVIGDSTSVAGGNQMAINYSSGGSGLTASPSGPTPADAYIQKLLDDLVTLFKDTTFNLYNYSVGGASIDQWYSNQNFGTTKPWIDHVKDVAPDLVIVSFGMNSFSYTLSAAVRKSFDDMLDYIAANFTTAPSIVAVTNPRPVNSTEDVWGSAEAQFSRMNASNAIRRCGYRRNSYIMDVGRSSDLARVGIDWDAMATVEEAVTDADFDALITSSVPRSGGIYTLTTTGSLMATKRVYRDFTLEFECAFQGAFTADASNLSLYYNYAAAGKSNVALIFPVAVGGAKSVNYSKYANPTENVGTMAWNGATALNDNVYRKYRLQKRGSLVELFIDNARLWAERIETWDVPGLIRLEKDGGGTIRLRNLKLYRVEYTDHLPTLTEYEMFGQHVDGNYDNKPLIGGNGVNHPASPGLAETYVRCIKELVQDLQMTDGKPLGST